MRFQLKKGNKDHIKVDCIKPRNGAGNPCLDHFGKKPQSVLKAMCEVTDSSATSNPRFDIHKYFFLLGLNGPGSVVQSKLPVSWPSASPPPITSTNESLTCCGYRIKNNNYDDTLTAPSLAVKSAVSFS